MTTAAICGVLAFGATLVIRAPRLPTPRVQAAGPVQGRTIVASGIPPRDREALRAVLRADPAHPDPWVLYQLALREGWAGDDIASADCWTEAEKAANEVHPSDPRGGIAAIVKGECARRRGDAEAAGTAFAWGKRVYEDRLEQRRAEQRGPNPRWSYFAGWCCRRLGDQAGADRHWGAVEEEIGRNIDGQRVDMEQYYTLARASALLRHQRRAIAALEQMASMGWRDRELLINAEEFEGLRGLPEFARITDAMRQRDRGASGASGPE